MFLVENYIEEDAYPEITADPICGMEIIQETTDNINAIEMAMIKLEHDAIMHEDASLLVEGEESFGRKILEFLKRSWERFKLFIDRVIEFFTRIHAKIRVAFANKNKIAEVIRKLPNIPKDSLEVNNIPLPKHLKNLGKNLKKFMTDTIKIVSGLNIADISSEDLSLTTEMSNEIEKELNDYIDRFTVSQESRVELTKECISEAAEIVLGYDNMLRFLKNMRQIIKDKMKPLTSGDPSSLGINSSQIKMLVIKIERVLTKLITFFNKVTVICCKILSKSIKALQSYEAMSKSEYDEYSSNTTKDNIMTDIYDDLNFNNDNTTKGKGVFDFKGMVDGVLGDYL